MGYPDGPGVMPGIQKEEEQADEQVRGKDRPEGDMLWVLKMAKRALSRDMEAASRNG